MISPVGYGRGAVNYTIENGSLRNALARAAQLGPTVVVYYGFGNDRIHLTLQQNDFRRLLAMCEAEQLTYLAHRLVGAGFASGFGWSAGGSNPEGALRSNSIRILDALQSWDVQRGARWVITLDARSNQFSRVTDSHIQVCADSPQAAPCYGRDATRYPLTTPPPVPATICQPSPATGPGVSIRPPIATVGIAAQCAPVLRARRLDVEAPGCEMTYEQKQQLYREFQGR